MTHEYVALDTTAADAGHRPGRGVLVTDDGLLDATEGGAGRVIHGP